MKLQNLFIFLTILLLASCEERYQPDITTEEPLLVVEGHIEVSSGVVPLPPYVILTRTIPFFAEITVEQIEELFVHDAFVQVSDGAQTITLEEVCWDELPEEFKDIVIETVPDLNGQQINYCIYTDLSFSFFGEEGKTYDLLVETDKEIATSTTTIPKLVPLDSVYFKPAPGGYGDSLLELQVGFTDPVLVDNFYRYFTSTNQSAFYPGFNSVFNDLLYAGLTVDFPLAKGEPPFRSAEDVSIFGLFRPGDEVVLRWLCIDQAHYKFWDTLEFNRVNQGPFGSYTQVKSNIEGAIGIWGGYSSAYYQLLAE
ncbi:MAG: DUF4249 domain-containing protein [Saprospiraceae bacterium]